MGSSPDRELAWMTVVGCAWLGDVAPHDNYGRIKVKWYKIGPYQRTIELPKDIMYRVTRVLMKCGKDVYSLTVDPNLALPESLQFDCDAGGGTMDCTWPDGRYSSLRPSIAQNTNYYRINDGLLTFRDTPPEGELVLEYLSQGDPSADTIIHQGYVESLRLYLTWQYYEQKNDMRRAKDFERQYNEQQRIANGTVKCPSFDEILDILSTTG
jgi:hypothetical protein